MLMDDRRNLAVPAVSLQNSPGNWEAVQHYSPKKVVGAIVYVLFANRSMMEWIWQGIVLTRGKKG